MLQTHSELRCPSASLELCLRTHFFIWFGYVHLWGFPDGTVIKTLPANAGDTGDASWVWVGKIPWRRKWLPTLIFLLGKHLAERSLAGSTSWGHRVGHNWARMHTCSSLCWKSTIVFLLFLCCGPNHFTTWKIPMLTSCPDPRRQVLRIAVPA